MLKVLDSDTRRIRERGHRYRFVFIYKILLVLRATKSQGRVLFFGQNPAKRYGWDSDEVDQHSAG